MESELSRPIYDCIELRPVPKALTLTSGNGVVAAERKAERGTAALFFKLLTSACAD